MARIFNKGLLRWSLALTVFLISFVMSQAVHRLNTAPSRLVNYRVIKRSIGQFIPRTNNSNSKEKKVKDDETVGTKNTARSQPTFPKRFQKPRRSRWRWKDWSPAACSSRSISTRRQRIVIGCQLWIRRLSFNNSTSRLRQWTAESGSRDAT